MTHIPNHTWADMLYYLREDPDLSGDEKAWILGRSARRLLKWQAVSAQAAEAEISPAELDKPSRFGGLGR